MNSVLRNFRPDLPIIVEIDASDFAQGAILSQKCPDGEYPVAFLSRKLTDAELNYEIYDKELQAIVQVFKNWRHFLHGAFHPITVVSDNCNLEWFMTSNVMD